MVPRIVLYVEVSEVEEREKEKLVVWRMYTSLSGNKASRNIILKKVLF